MELGGGGYCNDFSLSVFLPLGLDFIFVDGIGKGLKRRIDV